jgi:Zn-dependent peptidase ImmA (M78 family)
VALKRGFRTAAEQLATEVRKELGLAPSAAVDLREVAGHRGVRVVAADELVDIERLRDLERIQAFAFSACTFELNGTNVIVINPLRSPARQVSDLAHELSHLLIGHQLSEVREVAGSMFRACRPDEEEEATTLGATLLLPRPLLLRAAAQGMDMAAIAQTYGVTMEMARFRYHSTGVAKQMTRLNRFGRADTNTATVRKPSSR